MTYRCIEIEKAGATRILSLSRPEKKNAISFAMLHELDDAFRGIATDKSCNTVIIKGNGGLFSAGGDLKDIADIDESDAPITGIAVQEVFAKISILPQVVIACLDGLVAGGGAELALYCDIRIASSGFRLSLPEIKHGLIPGAGGIGMMSRFIGINNTLYYLASGREMNADTAFRLGLVQEVCSVDELYDTCLSLANSINILQPEVVATAKRLAWMNLSRPIDECLIAESREFGSLLNRFGKKQIQDFFSNKKKSNDNI